MRLATIYALVYIDRVSKICRHLVKGCDVCGFGRSLDVQTLDKNNEEMRISMCAPGATFDNIVPEPSGSRKIKGAVAPTFPGLAISPAGIMPWVKCGPREPDPVRLENLEIGRPFRVATEDG